jgi:hypothetical protein
MKNEKTAIAFLTLTAILLVVACLFVSTPQRAGAEITIKDRDYIVVTSPLQRGGDALYITDTRTGQMAVFVYDPASRGLQVGGVVPVANMFNR